MEDLEKELKFIKRYLVEVVDKSTECEKKLHDLRKKNKELRKDNEQLKKEVEQLQLRIYILKGGFEKEDFKRR